MLSRARRVTLQPVARFEWPQLRHHGESADPAVVKVLEAPPVADVVAPAPADLAEIERDAFAKGYEQGERAGVDTGRVRVDAMLERLGATIDELASLRRDIVARTERQLVQLALAIAGRIVQQAVAADPDQVLVSARLAVERLGPGRPVTIRLHPDDLAIAADGRAANWAGEGVTVQADAMVARGGCLVESDAGFIDASIDAQIGELSRAMLEEGSPVAVAARHAA